MDLYLHEIKLHEECEIKNGSVETFTGLLPFLHGNYFNSIALSEPLCIAECKCRLFASFIVIVFKKAFMARLSAIQSKCAVLHFAVHRFLGGICVGIAIIPPFSVTRTAL